MCECNESVFTRERRMQYMHMHSTGVVVVLNGVYLYVVDVFA